MGKTLLTILAALLIGHSLAFIGLSVYGFVTGRFDAEKREQYLATWNGEKLIPEPEEVVTEVVQEGPQEAGKKIEETQLEREIMTRELKLQEQLIRDKEMALSAARSKYEKDLKELLQMQQQFDKKVEDQNQQAQDEGFQKALKAYSTMKASYVKDDMMAMEDAEAVRYLSAMKASVATSILERFRTPEEVAKRQSIMRLLESQGTIDVADQQAVTSN